MNRKPNHLNEMFFQNDYKIEKKSKNIIRKKKDQLSNLLRTQHKNTFSDFHWIVFENKVFNVQK